MVTESYLRDKVRRYLKDKKGWYRKIHQSLFSAGIPDFIGCCQGKFIAIELKKDKRGKLDKLQQINIKEIREKGGGISFIAFGWDDFVRKFDHIYYNILKNKE